MKKALRNLLLLTFIMLASCSPRSAAEVPTTQPEILETESPTSSPVPSQTATQTPAPFTLNTPVIVLNDPMTTPTLTPTPPAFNLPLEMLPILRPGPGSQVTSPFRLTGRAGPTWEGEVLINLIGEDERLIYSTVAFLYANLGNAGLYSVLINFEIPGVAEAARLEILNRNRRDGRIDHRATMDIILLSEGEALTYYPDIHGPEKLAIFSPREDVVVEGGEAFISGGGWVDSNQALLIEVLDRQGEVIGSAQTELISPSIGRTGIFEALVFYEVEREQSGRMTVSEIDPLTGNILHMSSVIITLNP
jgi:hypothetical protein